MKICRGGIVGQVVNLRRIGNPPPVACMLLAAAPLFGWGCEGHQIVALIAHRHLTANAAAAVMQLLQQNPIDPALSRFCQDRPADPMADSSSWADDVKSAEKTSTWHYMDIPLGVHHADLNQYCEPIGPSTNGKERPGCIMDAIPYELDIVHNEKEAPADRANALRYLIHFIGDLHQPLHTTANNDHGGNCVPIQFFDSPRPSNLHGVWDSAIIQREMKSRGLNGAQLAAELDQRFEGKWKSWGNQALDVEKWVWEGHHLAEKITYGKLHPKVPLEPYQPHPDCPAESAKLEPLHLRVDSEYETAAFPVIEEQLAKAGYRLANILNTVWP